MSPRLTIQEGLHAQRIFINEHAKYIIEAKLGLPAFSQIQYPPPVFPIVTSFLNNICSDLLVTFNCSSIKEMDCWTFPKPNAVSSLSDEPKGLSHWGNCTIEYFTKKWKKDQVLKGRQTERFLNMLQHCQHHYAQDTNGKELKGQRNQQLLFVQRNKLWLNHE